VSVEADVATKQTAATLTAENLNAARTAALRPARAGLANRDFSPSSMVFWGASMTEGGPGIAASIGPANRYRRWLDKLQLNLRSRLPLSQPVAGGLGYIPAFFQTFFAGGTSQYSRVTPDGVTYSGNLVGYGSGLGNRSLGLVAVTDWVQFTFTGDAFDLFLSTHTTASTVAAISIDGGAATNYTLPAQTLKSDRYRVTGLAVSSHTVRVTWVSTGPVVVDGLMAYNGDRDKGIQIWDAAKGSSKASDYGTDSSSRIFQDLSFIQPQLMGVEFGYNEYFGNVASATFQVQLSGFVGYIQAKVTTPPTMLFIIWPEPQHPSTPLEPYVNYVAAIKAVAAATTKGIVVDFSERLPSPVTDNTLGFFYTDKVHPSDKGSGYIADVLAEVIASK
jgi:lysophospholipase L1-like esterase